MPYYILPAICMNPAVMFTVCYRKPRISLSFVIACSCHVDKGVELNQYSFINVHAFSVLFAGVNTGIQLQVVLGYTKSCTIDSSLWLYCACTLYHRSG